MDLFRRLNAHFGTHVPDCANDVFYLLEPSVLRRENEFLAISGVRLQHDSALFAALAPDLFGNKRSKGVHQLQYLFQNVSQYRQSPGFFRRRISVQRGLCQLDIPIAKIAPDKIVQLRVSHAEFVFFQIAVDFFNRLVEFVQYPFVGGSVVKATHFRQIYALCVHQNEPGSIPQFVQEIPAGLHFVFAEADIRSGSYAGSQTEAQCVGSVFVYKHYGVDAVTQGFGHLSALGVTNDTVDQHFGEGYFAHMFQSAENHSGDPEEDDVVSGDQQVRGIEVFQVFRFVRVSQGRERPQSRREPSIQNVFVTLQVVAAALRADRGIGLVYDDFAAVRAIPCGNLVTPPQLSGNTPIADVVHPIEIYLFKAFGDKGDLFVFDDLYSRLCKRLHFHKPLLADDGFDGAVATVAYSDVVFVRFDLFHQALLFQVAYYALSGFVAVQPFICVAVFVDNSAVVHYANDG